MRFGKKMFACTAAVTLAAMAPFAAQAGLLGSGGTVQAVYYNGVFAGPELEINQATGNALPASLVSPVTYDEGALDFAGIVVGDTRITITNLANFPFCFDGASVGTACADQISGFGFLFTGVDITGASVDPASAADFLPVSGTFQSNTHQGLQLFGNNHIQADVTGDIPAISSQLIFDLTFGATQPPPNGVPEPGSLALLAAAVGLAGIRRRRTPAS